MANTFVRKANLSGADLTGAELVNTDELERTALSLEGATMPNGRKYGEGSRNLPIMLACLVVAFLLSRGAHRRRADN